MGITESEMRSRLRECKIIAEGLYQGVVGDVFFNFDLMLVLRFEGGGGLGIGELGKESVADCGHDCVCSSSEGKDGDGDDVSESEPGFLGLKLCRICVCLKNLLI